MISIYPRALANNHKFIVIITTYEKINLHYHIKCSVIQGFLAQGEAVITHVKKFGIFSRALI